MHGRGPRLNYPIAAQGLRSVPRADRRARNFADQLLQGKSKPEKAQAGWESRSDEKT